MTETMQPSRRITVLREEVARKIAAGEVIDRPFSVLRELLDNSLDAGAHNVEIALEQGGLTGLRVVDDGWGMGEEDLRVCTHRHATSKIREAEDLARARSLGFRGEALAAIAACSRLEIVTLTEGAGHAHRLRVEGGHLVALEDSQGGRGTRVEVNDLFYNLPARRHFLKSAAAESAACRRVLVEKALAFPEVAFRFFSDGSLKFFFPPADLKQRICSAFALETEHLELLSGGGQGLGLTLVAARPELARRDRRLLQVYVNRRRLEEYRLLQALEYAYRDFMPGGQFPICFAFLDLDPALVDFNIHPAKKEARFRDPDALRRGMRQLLEGHLEGFRVRPRSSAGASPGPAPARESLLVGQEDRTAVRLRPAPLPPPHQAREAAVLPDGPLYRGRIFGLFLLAEVGSRLLIIDQHAAHERVIYERLKNRRSPVQELLFPMRFELTPGEAALLASRREFLDAGLGIGLELQAGPACEITRLPEEMLSLEETALRAALLEREGSPEELAHRLYSLAACRMAVKEGEALDDAAAAGLIGDLLSLGESRCPHGRPIWVELSREELERRVART